MSFSSDEARAVGERIGIDWSTSPFDVEEFRAGMDVELEHGRRDPKTNVTDDDEITTGKIAWALRPGLRLAIQFGTCHRSCAQPRALSLLR